MKKERLDKILVDLGYFDTKSKSSAHILAGEVKINGEKITKAGFQIDISTIKDVEIKSMPFVSRGGFKLEKALKVFEIDTKDRVCFDAGASTGGFTDCLLQSGAKFVYAVDVGHSQLAWKLREDKRIKVIEKTNLKNCQFNDIFSESDERPTLLVCDVSFISLDKVLPNLKTFMSPTFHEMVCLIKPQFEAGKNLVEHGGVVTNPKIHTEIIDNILKLINGLGYGVLGLTHSPIKGPKGNIEYLIYFSSDYTKNIEISSKEVVSKAFNSLN